MTRILVIQGVFPLWLGDMPAFFHRSALGRAAR